MRKTLTVVIAAATLATGGILPAQAKPILPDRAELPTAAVGVEQVQYNSYRRAQRRAERDARGCYRGEPLRDCRERTNWERRYGSRYYYNGGRYYTRRSDGSEVAAAIIGFALGAAILGSRSDYDYYYSRRNDRRYIEGCRVRYRSFDPYTGTYVTSTGYRRYCRY